MLKTQAKPSQIMINEYLWYMRIFPDKEKTQVPLNNYLLILQLIPHQKNCLSDGLVPSKFYYCYYKTAINC